MDPDEVSKKLDYFWEQLTADIPDAPEKAMKHLDDMITYCEGVTDNEADPIIKMSNQLLLFSLNIVRGILDVAFQTRKKFENIAPKLNNFEDRIGRLEKRIADMEKGR
ncbi:MAG TPA: hypothetical protein VLD38_00320 [Nitrosopumilaceae archaeon]|nr:hypothetical protein [Nitrosopumilaceae archaeon]